MPRELLNVLS